jgi:hypothetical protein
MSVSEPGGELREALESLWEDWREANPDGLMQFSDFLSPEIESALRVTFRYLLHSKLPPSVRPSGDDLEEMVDNWVEHFALTLRDKRPTWLDDHP